LLVLATWPGYCAHKGSAASKAANADVLYFVNKNFIPRKVICRLPRK
jgi:hypothetical protein